MEETSEERKKMLDNADKLDSMMLILLRFLRGILASNSGAAREHKDWTWGALREAFHARVLTTFRSKYTQFVFFYACSFQTQSSSDLLQSLIVKIIDNKLADTARHSAGNPNPQPPHPSPLTPHPSPLTPHPSPLTPHPSPLNPKPYSARHHTGSYLGSFLARARFLRLSNVVLSLRLLVTWILEYMDKQCPMVQGPDPNHHSLFYSLVQALLYVLCFRLPQVTIPKP
jgi:RNA polymerase I-specific transcription initiation factor RRN3